MLKSYKELIVWQRSIELAEEIYCLTSDLPKSEVYGLSIQMRRAAVSIASNIAEGQKRKTLADFLRFLRMADGSAAELETQIVISQRFYRRFDYSKAEKLLEEAQKMLNVMIRKLEFKNHLQSTNYKLKTNGGYIAITSALIISLLVMAVTFSVSLAGFYNRSNISNSEYKEMSNALAEGCVEVALLNIAAMSTYAGNETVPIDDKQCNIFPIETVGGQKIIKTKAIFQSAVTNLKVTVNSTDLTIVSWEEIPTL